MYVLHESVGPLVGRAGYDDRIASLYVDFRDVKNSTEFSPVKGVLGPDWFNLYGASDDALHSVAATKINEMNQCVVPRNRRSIVVVQFFRFSVWVGSLLCQQVNITESSLGRPLIDAAP